MTSQEQGRRRDRQGNPRSRNWGEEGGGTGQVQGFGADGRRQGRGHGRGGFPLFAWQQGGYRKQKAAEVFHSQQQVRTRKGNLYLLFK